ncbi:MAG: nicotinic acid mononucleotide adenylyltransferase [Halothiobacillus sp. 13-55-253]|nr:MAG: nicotinic acid mononucleotide adenylyltransferase [Halothiobacillus sp. 13-55-253]
MAISVADTPLNRVAAPLLGILGGTFDPIHLGHLRLAEEVSEALDLAAVHFVPSAVPPHRPQPSLGAAIADHPGFIADGRELERAGVSYTVDTLKSFAAEFPERHRVLILGMDAFNGLPQWHRWQELFDWAHIAVANRPGAAATGEAAALLVERRLQPEQLARQRSGGVVALEITRLDISATAIRAALDAGRSVRYLVPDCLLNPLQAYYSDPDSGLNTH